MKPPKIAFLPSFKYWEVQSEVDRAIRLATDQLESALKMKFGKSLSEGDKTKSNLDILDVIEKIDFVKGPNRSINCFY